MFRLVLSHSRAVQDYTKETIPLCTQNYEKLGFQYTHVGDYPAHIPQRCESQQAGTIKHLYRKYRPEI